MKPADNSKFTGKFTIAPAEVTRLIEALTEAGFETVGPRLRDGAIVYDHIRGHHDLPIGKRDRQDAATYRIEERGDDALFGYVVGPHSWKKFVHPDGRELWRARRSEHGLVYEDAPAPPAYAFIGVRACELAALGILDTVFASGPLPHGDYEERRARAFIIAVNCTEPGGTCFCASMETGPSATSGYDLALTELIEDGAHRLLLEVGSDRGAAFLEEAGLDLAEAEAADTTLAASLLDDAAGKMGRSLETDGLPQALAANLDHPHWQDVASRCLACANCTMVCPTCFCTTVEDHTSLGDDLVGRTERWDSCFTLDFTRLTSGPVRQSGASRYRQWLTHKLSSWHDQFGTSGCVGCGRCITWCPVGIDITKEAAAIATTAEPETDGQERETTR